MHAPASVDCTAAICLAVGSGVQLPPLFVLNSPAEMNEVEIASKSVAELLGRLPNMAGLIDLVSTRDIPADSTVLYAHLGGQLALNAYSGLFRS